MRHWSGSGRARNALRCLQPLHRSWVVFLLSEAAAEVTGQIFDVRANEIMQFSQPRSIRSVHYTPEWTPEAIAKVALPAMQK